jgi:hypothetical protein
MQPNNQNNSQRHNNTYNQQDIHPRNSNSYQHPQHLQYTQHPQNPNYAQQHGSSLNQNHSFSGLGQQPYRQLNPKYQQRNESFPSNPRTIFSDSS